MTINRRLLGAVLLPILLINIGLTLGNAFVPLYARTLGASMAGAALAASLLFIGQAAADLPGGWLVHRFGEKNILAAAGVLMILAIVLRFAAGNLALFSFTVILFGIGTSLFWIAQMSWMKKEIGGDDRGRAMSLVGGSLRLANIIGPLAGGYLAELAGYRVLFAVQGLFCSAALAVMILMISPVPRGEGTYRKSIVSAAERWRSNRSTILAAVAGIGGLTVLRASRSILIPLWGGEMGLSEGRVGIVMFTGAAVDASLFWLSGIIMTRWGRKTAAVICTAGLALAIALLPAARSFPLLILVSVLAGTGNAMGAGINLTISGDLAPRDAPAAFLSFWRFIQGFAGFGGPALAAWTIRVAGSSAAPPVTAAIGFTGALLMLIFMKETRSRRM